MVVRLTLNSMNPKVVGSNLGLDIIFFFSFKPFVCVIFLIIVLFVVVFIIPFYFHAETLLHTHVEIIIIRPLADR